MIEMGRYYRDLAAPVPPMDRKTQVSLPMQKNNPFRQASYVLSAHELRQLPPDAGIEVAIAGRSNAGKSSAINALTDQKALARTSKTPGRTQQIVIFRIDDERRIADLPGYGFAKVPLALKQHWQKVLEAYFRSRKCLRGVVLVMDIRHPMQPFDQQMLAWCDAARVPCHVVLTKADKLKRGPARSALLGVRKQLPAIASAQIFSARSREGVEDLIGQLAKWFEFDQDQPGSDAD